MRLYVYNVLNAEFDSEQTFKQNVVGEMISEWVRMPVT